MPDRNVYLDNHSTTPVDPRVVEAIAPYWSDVFANPGSISHAAGHEARQAVECARDSIAGLINASPREIVFTSGATESNNLALCGAFRRGQTGPRRFVSLATEHRSVLAPLARLARRDARVTLVKVTPVDEPRAGEVDLQAVLDAVHPDTTLVSVMLANNETGVIQPVAAIAELAHRVGAIVHCDATQAIGKIKVDVEALGVDLLSFTAHKIYGPKGIGALYVRRDRPDLRLVPLVEGGGQEQGMRSGTLNVPGIVGLARALQLCHDSMATEANRLHGLRNRLYDALENRLDGVRLNGPDLALADLRLAGNLNVSFEGVDGDALMAGIEGIAVSSGSACTSTDPRPSHVLLAMGRSDALAKASLRFGLGRFNTAADIDLAADAVSAAIGRLRSIALAGRAVGPATGGPATGRPAIP